MAPTVIEALQIASFVLGRVPDAQRLMQTLMGMSPEERQELYRANDESMEDLDQHVQQVLARRTRNTNFPSTAVED